MSRVSLSRRMAAVEAAVRQGDPFGYAVHHLPSPLRQLYEEWRNHCERITERIDSPYAAMIEGRLHFPSMPPTVATAIDARLCSRPVRADCTEDDARNAYNLLLGEAQW